MIIVFAYVKETFDPIDLEQESLDKKSLIASLSGAHFLPFGVIYSLK